MTDSLQDVHSSSIKIKLGDEEFSFMPLSFKQLSKFEAWCKMYDYNCLKSAGADQDDLNTMLDRVMAKPFDISKIDDYMQTPSGMVELLWLSLEKQDITRDQLAEKLTLNNINILFEAVMKITNPDAVDDDDDEKKTKKS